jgi:hypothetical protein
LIIYFYCKKIVLFLCTLIFITTFSGCAQPNTWTKQGITQEIFDRDFAKCQREAWSASHTLNGSGEVGLERSVMEENLIKKCMYSKGYELKNNQ